MTRAERVCAKLPTWMLRALLSTAAKRSWWSAAYLELWRREVLDVVQAEADAESGPWPVVMPDGRQ
jgi:hypothetical protein